jgi:uncharacterized protein (TIGR00730 family)
MKTISLEQELSLKHFRVAIFGSARLPKEDPLYAEIRALSMQLSKQDIDVVTGGGPGVMEAANEGHKAGKSTKAHSIGLTVDLPFEKQSNRFLDLEQHFHKFSGRLDTFMKLSQAIVVFPGGIGTCLELFYTWQLIQVGHICNIPIILKGELWKELISWVDTYLVKEKRMKSEDMHMICLAHTTEDVMKIINEAHTLFKEHGEGYCLNCEKYR